MVDAPWLNITDSEDNITFYLVVYGAIAGANSVFTMFRAFLFAYGGILAAQSVHSKLLGAILKVSVNFYCLCALCTMSSPPVCELRMYKQLSVIKYTL